MSVLTAEEREGCLMAATRRYLDGRMSARTYRAAEARWSIDHRAMFLELAYRLFVVDEARAVARQIDTLLEEGRGCDRRPRLLRVVRDAVRLIPWRSR